MNVTSLVKMAKHFIGKHSPIILTSVSIAGSIGIAVVASRDTLNANDVILEYRMQHHDQIDRVTLIKKAAPCYIPTILTVTATITAIVGAHVTSQSKIAAYSNAYVMAQEAARLYKDKVADVVGEKKAAEISDKVATAQVRDASKSAGTVIVGDGNVLCYDSLSGRYFSSTAEKLRKVQNDINFDIQTDMWASLNDFYDKIGLPPINLGEELGWSNDYNINLKFSSVLTDDNRPAVVVEFDHSPFPDTERRY